MTSFPQQTLPPSRVGALPVSALIGAMLSIQFGATLAKNLFPLVGAEGTSSLRLVVGALLLGAVLRPWRGPVPREVVPALVGYGAVLGVMNLCFYMSLRTIPLGVAVAIEFTGPLTVAVLSSRRAVDFVWIALAVAGLLLLSPAIHTPHPLDPVGMLYALGAGTGWGVYILLGQRAGAVLETRATAIGMFVAAVLLLPLGLAHLNVALLRWPALLWVLGVGVFSSALPFSLEMVALTRLSATAYGTLTSLEPAIGALLGLLLLYEHLTVPQWAGIAVVIVAAAGATSTTRGPVVVPE